MIESLHEPDGPGVDEAWDAEIRRRVEELDSGAVRGSLGRKSENACSVASSELIWHPAILEAPERWSKPRYGCRRFVFPNQYPYTLVDRLTPAVEIVAVAHQRRRPDYWKRR